MHFFDSVQHSGVLDVLLYIVSCRHFITKMPSIISYMWKGDLYH